MKGDLALAKETSMKALRLQGAQTKTKPIEIPKPKKAPELVRGDIFVLPIFRRHDQTLERIDKTKRVIV